jgi:uncharacterized membrane protein
MPHIAADNFPALGAVIFGLAWLGFWADRHPIASKLSGVPWVLTAALLLANIGVIPLASPAYDFVGQYLLPLGIPLLLLKANFRKMITQGGWVLPAFAIASLGVCIGATLGYYVFDLGPEGAKIAGTYAGAFIGGVTDFVAVSQAVDMTPTTFTVALSASAPAAIVGLFILVSIPSVPWIRRLIPSKIMDQAAAAEQRGTTEQLPRLRLDHIAGAIALSFAICALAQLVCDRWHLGQYRLFVITIITVVLANLLPGRFEKLEGEFPLGMLCMYAFFAIIGAGTNAVVFLKSAPILFFYCTSMLLVQFVVVLVVGKLLKLDLADILMGSAAAIIGAAAAAGVASAKGWKTLITPAITVGMFWLG